jgi:hypothetical protein
VIAFGATTTDLAAPGVERTARPAPTGTEVVFVFPHDGQTHAVEAKVDVM